MTPGRGVEEHGLNVRGKNRTRASMKTWAPKEEGARRGVEIRNLGSWGRLSQWVSRIKESRGSNLSYGKEEDWLIKREGEKKKDAAMEETALKCRSEKGGTKNSFS